MTSNALALAIAEISPTFLGRLIQPGNPRYESARQVHNGLIDKRPALIAQCRGKADVRDAVRLARRAGLPIAVRGGAHNVGGKATVDKGVVIDLSLMKGVHINRGERTAVVEGGVTWGEFNRESLLYGLATTGGLISSTGVAGLTLGGGIGWLMSRHGLALDNVFAVDLVLADGTPARASSGDNPDLFWAVRGGGGNFGVATAFEFDLHPIPATITAGLVAHPLERARDVLRFFRDVTTSVPDDMMLVAGLLTGPDGETKLAAIVAAHFGSPEDAAASMQPLKAFGPPVTDAIGPTSYAALSTMLDPSFPKGARNYWKSHFLDRLTDDAIDTLVAQFAECPSPMSQVLLEHFHGAATRVTPTDTAYALRQPGYNMLALSQWMNPADDDPGIAWAKETYAAMQPHVGRSRYLNYLNHDDTGESVLAAAYGPNLSRLRQIKATYDPANVFHLNVNIPPAL